MSGGPIIGDPQVAWIWEATMDWKSSPRLLEKFLLSEKFPALSRDHAYLQESEYETFFNFTIPKGLAWGHVIMIPGRDQSD